MQLDRRRTASFFVDILSFALFIGVVFLFLAHWDGVKVLKRLADVWRSGIPSLSALYLFFPSSSTSRSFRESILPNADWVRLCKIRNASDGGIDLVVESFRLADAPPYRALSYTWGPAEGVAEDVDPLLEFAFNNNTIKRALPKNLIRALIQVREWEDDSYYWIDSVCINQHDAKERSEQVNHMDKIYSQAAAVDVWLGRSNKRTLKLISILGDLRAMSIRYGNIWSDAKLNETSPNFLTSGHLLPDNEWDVLTSFLSRRWFHRLWTLQEFALAQSVRVILGNYTIDPEVLREAALFLYSSSVNVNLTYGKTDHVGAAVAQQSLLRMYMERPDRLNLSLLSEQDFPKYESVLAWVYWRSASTLATDPRDYVYGITGIANALMDRLAQTRGVVVSYQPIKADYSLTVAQVYQAFIARLMHGSVGIRAIALIQPSPEWEFQSRYNNRDLSLPSWVPNLADRDRFALSNNGAFKSQDFNQTAANVFGKRRLEQKFSIHAGDLHAFGHPIGTIRTASRPFPYEMDFKYCAEFFLNAIRVLADMPTKHYGTEQTPIESFIATMTLGLRTRIKPGDVEKFLASGTAARVWIDMVNGRTFDKAMEDPLISQLQSIYGVSADFLKAELSQARHPEKIFLWRDARNTKGMEKGAIPLMESCRDLIAGFGQAKGQRVIGVALDETLLEGHTDSGRRSGMEISRVMGMVSDTARTEDEIWAVQGSEWPFVLRPKYVDESKTEVARTANRWSRNRWWRWGRATKTVPVYQFIGEAYVHGIMHGELLGGRDDLELRELVLR